MSAILAPRISGLSTATLWLSIALLLIAASAYAAPTPKQALGLNPIQPDIDYDQPADAEADRCTIQPEKSGDVTAWVVRDAEGQLLRRFSDTNGDNVVDQWSYCRNGVEVYRDIDADYNGKADQYRWFQTAGTRWGLDKNENGKIDSWKQISPFEVAEVAIQALQRGDADLYAALLPSGSELESLGLGKETSERLGEEVRKAQAEFSKLAVSQKVVSKSTEFLDFGATRPALAPAGIEGSTKDLMVYENVAALIENNGKPEQVYLGAMVRVGDNWRLLGLPQLGDAPTSTNLFTRAGATGVAPDNGDSPSDEIQKLLAQLEKLDSQTGGDSKEQVKLAQQRAKILSLVSDISPAGVEREQWQRQLADMLSAAAQTLQYDGAIGELEQLGKQLKQQRASEDLQAHVEFRRLWAEYGKAQFEPKADYAKVQEAWLTSLEKFTKDYPSNPDTAEAMLQLGMAKEFAGEEEAAVEWYNKLASSFGSTDAGKKAKGAMRRLDSIGKPWRLAGSAVGGGQIDLAGYRRKYVLVHYWATWCEPCKEDIEKLQELYAKYNRQGFDIVGVNLDSSVGEAQQFLAKARLPWKHMYDEGGLDGRLANEMGVMTLPLMLLVDDKGEVINRNIHVAELETELKRVLR